MKKNLKIFGVIIVGAILLIGVYICFLNITCPIKGTYVYNNDESVTLQFKNGMYIFKGEGTEYDNIVNIYGNYVRCSLDEIEQQDNTYSSVSKIKRYYLTAKKEDEQILVTIKEDGTLSLLYGVIDSSYIEFHKLER